MKSFKINDQICTGCGLCSSVSDNINLNKSEKGFLRPTITSDSKDKYIENICPGFRIEKPADVSKTDSIWGNIYDSKIVRSTNKKVLNNASSGGGITSILTFLLDNNIVDRIIQIGPHQNNPILNQVYVHNDPKIILKCANSRYSPSAALVNISDILKNEFKYAFVGKPCDIAGLNNYLKLNGHLSSKIILKISFFCAGIPSENGTLKLIRQLNFKINEIESLSYRKNGWPGEFTVESPLKKNSLSYKYSWGRVLGKSLQFRCKICPDGIGHQADLVFADAWKEFDDNGYPLFKNSVGQSIVLSRSKIGRTVLNKVILRKDLEVIGNLTVPELKKMQPGQYRRINELKYRLFFIKIINPKINFDRYYNFEGEVKTSRKLKIMFGTLIRYFQN